MYSRFLNRSGVVGYKLRLYESISICKDYIRYIVRDEVDELIQMGMR